MQLKTWLHIWLDKYERYSIKLRTFLKYQEIIQQHINPILGEYELENLNYEIIQIFVIEKIEHGNLLNHTSLSTNTVRSIVSVLKQSFKQAIALKIIVNNPMSFVKIPPSTEKEVCAFDRKEQKIIENFCLNHTRKNYIGIVICLYTGIRLGELLALTWEDIDFEKKTMRINKTSFFSKGKIYVDIPKTKCSNRIIPLPQNILKILWKRYKKSQSLYIITTRENGMVAVRSFQKTFASILRKCHIPYRNFHSLRHTFATRAMEMGMDVKTISEILGHKNAMITLARYSHSLFEYKVKMMNRLCLLMDEKKTLY